MMPTISICTIYTSCKHIPLFETMGDYDHINIQHDHLDLTDMVCFHPYKRAPWQDG